MKPSKSSIKRSSASVNGVKRVFGRLPAVDERDARYRIKRTATDRTRRFWRDTHWKGADQGKTPRCVGYAAAMWLAASPTVQYADPNGMYELATLVDEWPDTYVDDAKTGGGTSVRAVLKILKHLRYIGEYRWANSVRQCLPHMLERGPIILGTAWLEGMCEPDDQGFIYATGSVYGGHAYLWSGVDVDLGFARIKCAWGDDWGDGGHAKLPLEDLDRLIKDEGEAATGVEVKPHY